MSAMATTKCQPQSAVCLWLTLVDRWRPQGASLKVLLRTSGPWQRSSYQHEPIKILNFGMTERGWVPFRGREKWFPSQTWAVLCYQGLEVSTESPDWLKKKNQATPLTAGLHSLSTGLKLGRSKQKLPCSPIQPDASLFSLSEGRAPSSASLLKPETWEAFPMSPVPLYLVPKASSFSVLLSWKSIHSFCLSCLLEFRLSFVTWMILIAS